MCYPQNGADDNHTPQHLAAQIGAHTSEVLLQHSDTSLVGTSLPYNYVLVYLQRHMAESAISIVGHQPTPVGPGGQAARRMVDHRLSVTRKQAVQNVSSSRPTARSSCSVHHRGALTTGRIAEETRRIASAVAR